MPAVNSLLSAQTASSELPLSQVIQALSHALDLTEGQPRGHCVRCAWIGMHIGRELCLDSARLSDLHYTLPSPPNAPTVAPSTMKFSMRSSAGSAYSLDYS